MTYDNSVDVSGTPAGMHVANHLNTRVDQLLDIGSIAGVWSVGVWSTVGVDDSDDLCFKIKIKDKVHEKREREREKSSGRGGGFY